MINYIAQEANRQHCTLDGFRTESFAVYTEVNETEIGVATVQAPSNITGTTKANTSAEDPLAPTENETALKIGVGAAVAGCVFMLCIVLLLLAVMMMMMLKCYRRQRTPNTDNSSKGTQDEAPVNAPIYESSSQVQNYVREDSNNPSPYYSIPLPTDACVAYGAMKLRQ